MSGNPLFIGICNPKPSSFAICLDKGILYIGLMIVKGQPKVLEFNVRFGDPEAEVLIPRLSCDIVDLFDKTIDCTLDFSHIKWKEDSSITVVLTSKGYPNN